MRASLPICLVLCAAVPAWTQSSAPPPQPRVTPLAGVAVASGPVVVITAAGPLPAPTIGVLHSPERIYVDLPGISSRTSSTEGDGDLVTAVRVAQHSLDPLVARIVIDLTRPSRYVVNAAQRESGRLEMSFGASVSNAVELPRADATPPRPIARPTATNPTQRYASRIGRALDDASALRSVLHDLDRKTAVSPDRLQPAQAELSRLRSIVDGLRPPARLADAQDLLRSALGFATTALTLAASSTTDVPANASAAAAGALMTFDRAVAEIGADPGKKGTDQVVGRGGGW